jgi:hypothetical protein
MAGRQPAAAVCGGDPAADAAGVPAFDRAQLPADIRHIGAGAGIALFPLMSMLHTGVDILISGVTAGSIAYGVHWWRERERA